MHTMIRPERLRSWLPETVFGRLQDLISLLGAGGLLVIQDILGYKTSHTTHSFLHEAKLRTTALCGAILSSSSTELAPLVDFTADNPHCQEEMATASHKQDSSMLNDTSTICAGQI